MTEQEKQDLDNAPPSSNGRTPAQTFALSVYNLVKALIKQDLSSEKIAYKLQQAKIYHFLTEEERREYNKDKSPTDAQRKVAQIKKQIGEMLKKSFSYDKICQEVSSYRRGIADKKDILRKYITEEEKRDYDNVPKSSDKRTPAQKYAVYVHDWADKLNGLGSDPNAIRDKLEAERIHYFMTKEEKKYYNRALPEDKESTNPRRKSVLLYRKIQEIIRENFNFDDIYRKVQDVHHEIYDDSITRHSDSSKDHFSDADPYSVPHQDREVNRPTIIDHDPYVLGLPMMPYESGYLMPWHGPALDYDPYQDREVNLPTIISHDRYGPGLPMMPYERSYPMPWHGPALDYGPYRSSDISQPIGGNEYFPQRYTTSIPGKSGVYSAHIPNGCTADATQMLLHDRGIDVSDHQVAYLLGLSGFDGACLVHRVTPALNACGLPSEWKQLKFKELKDRLKEGSVIAAIHNKMVGAHSVVVDKIDDAYVHIRDGNWPVPYKVTIESWKNVWQPHYGCVSPT
jgi:hypothetical protein